MTDTDITVEWDLDNDGDYDQSVEDITAYVLSGESITGRNWPSMLQGKATPGTLTLRLDNQDDRFSFFNTGSPLATSPFSLQSGRRIRVRLATSTPNDPAVLVKDRFDGTGAIGTTENGLTWGTVGGGTPTGSWLRVAGGYLEAQGETQYAVVDASTVDGYAQAQLGAVDIGNFAGLVYRWTDVNNHGRFVYNTTSGALTHDSVTGGTVTTTALGVTMEAVARQYLGIDVSSTTAKVFVNGVEKASTTAHVGAGTEWGLYADWVGGNTQRPITFEEYWMWDQRLAVAGGEIWTGKVESVLPDVAQDGRKIAVLKAVGPIANLAATTIRPPHTLGGVVQPSRPGELVGNCFGRAGELHPPTGLVSSLGGVAAGSFDVGPVGYEDMSALSAARRFEEAEQGFVYETAEGGMAFDARADRGTGSSLATFSDDPLEALNYESFELLDWRREIINRVEASVSVMVPELAGIFLSGRDSAAGAVNQVDITNPDFATDGAVAGDLVVHVIASAVFTTGEPWLNPSGWRNMRTDLGDDAIGQMRIYAKVLAASDVGTVVRFYNDTGTAGGGWAAGSLLFQNWRGAIEDGLVVEVNGLGDFPTGAASRAGTHLPPTLFPPWGREPSHFVVARSGAVATTGAPTITADADNITPDGYGNMSTVFTNSAAGSTYDAAVQVVNKVDSTSVEEPTVFGGSFTNFDHLDVATIAVRGAPPVAVTVNDLASQTDHNSIRTHVNPAKIFPDATEADDYCDEILARYADDAPILRFSYTANKDSAHHLQAYTRRVTDLITVEANNNTGMGISGDFIIESVRHKWDRGNTRWTVTYECAQV